MWNDFTPDEDSDAKHEFITICLNLAVPYWMPNEICIPFSKHTIMLGRRSDEILAKKIEKNPLDFKSRSLLADRYIVELDGLKQDPLWSSAYELLQEVIRIANHLSKPNVDTFYYGVTAARRIAELQRMDDTGSLYASGTEILVEKVEEDPSDFKSRLLLADRYIVELDDIKRDPLWSSAYQLLQEAMQIASVSSDNEATYYVAMAGKRINELQRMTTH